MSDVSRTTMATRMLTSKLPDGDVAAEMLLSADIQNPVKMQTPPNPARCQNLIRGSFIKAATLAMSTDDPATLEKLAKHASLGVKLAVVHNPVANDVARRIVEVAALKRGDNEMLEGVLSGASLEYIMDALDDDSRKGRVLSVAVSRGLLASLIADSETKVSEETLVKLLEADPKRVVEVVGRTIGTMWPCHLDPVKLAGLCAGDPADEAKFLSSFISAAGVFDDKVAEALDRVAFLRPDIVNPSNLTLRAKFAAKSMTPKGRICLMATSLGTAKVAYAIEQTPQVVNEISDKYGVEAALDAVMSTEIEEHNRDAIASWLLGNLEHLGPNAGQRIIEPGVASWMLPHVKSDQELVDLLHKTPRSFVYECFVGQKLPLTMEQRKLVARTFPGDLLKYLRHLKDPSEKDLLFKEAFATGQLVDILTNMHLVGDHLGNEEIVELIRRVADACETANAGTGSSTAMDYRTAGRPMTDLLTRESFIEYIDDENTEGRVLLWWLRLAKRRGLSLEFLSGARRRKLTDGEFAELLEHPGDMFELSMAQALVRMFHDFSQSLPVEVLDKLVDAAGTPVISQLNVAQSGAFSDYLAERLTRSGLNHEEWLMAFELLSKSPTSVGAAIAAARRLVRAKRAK